MEWKPVGYTNSSWCGEVDDRKSTTGYVFMLGGTPVFLSSRKKHGVALSSCEEEYIATSLCSCQTIWLLNLIDEIEGKFHGAMTVKINNMSPIN